MEFSTFDYKPQLGPDYRLSTKVGNLEAYRAQFREMQETERKFREAAARTDERAEIVQLEVAGTVLSLTQREAALVVYVPEAWAGLKIEATSARQGRLLTFFSLAATVVGRPLGERTVHAATFPRIQPISYIGWHEGERSTRCKISTHRKDTWYKGYYDLFLGNVTEVDWTNRTTLGLGDAR